MSTAIYINGEWVWQTWRGWLLCRILDDLEAGLDRKEIASRWDTSEEYVLEVRNMFTRGRRPGRLKPRKDNPLSPGEEGKLCL